MKTILALLTVILCSLNAFGQGAQYRPTPFANGFVQTVTSQGTAQTYLGIGSSNNIGLRLLSSAPSPTYISTLPVVTNPTNNGDYNLVTPVSMLTIPPLLGSNSGITLTIYSLRTNANISSGNIALWIGPNTNFLATVASSMATTVGQANVFSFNVTGAIQSFGSWTNQVCVFASAAVIGPSNFFDSSVTNTLYIGAYTPAGTARTNDIIFGVAAYEVYRP